MYIAAAVAIMSNLICYCSTAAVSCLCLVRWLPTPLHGLGSLTGAIKHEKMKPQALTQYAARILRMFF